MFTDGKLHELPEIYPYLKGIFKEIYSVDTLGLGKKNTKAYKALASLIGTNPIDITFIDDKSANIEAATRAGVNAIHYISNETLIQKLSISTSR